MPPKGLIIREDVLKPCDENQFNELKSLYRLVTTTKSTVQAVRQQRMCLTLKSQVRTTGDGFGKEGIQFKDEFSLAFLADQNRKP